MATGRERAEDLLVHYLSTAWRAAGLTWDSDNDSEVRGIIDALLGMVREEIQEHAENAPHPYPDGSVA